MWLNQSIHNNHQWSYWMHIFILSFFFFISISFSLFLVFFFLFCIDHVFNNQKRWCRKKSDVTYDHHFDKDHRYIFQNFFLYYNNQTQIHQDKEGSLLTVKDSSKKMITFIWYKLIKIKKEVQWSWKIHQEGWSIVCEVQVWMIYKYI